MILYIICKEFTDINQLVIVLMPRTCVCRAHEYVHAQLEECFVWDEIKVLNWFSEKQVFAFFILIRNTVIQIVTIAQIVTID